MWFRRPAIGVVAVLGLVSVVSARELTFEDRVGAQKAIEQVYWSHRVWPADNPGPKPPLSEVMSDPAIRSRVESYLLESNALDALWHRPITSSDLQRELDRMAANSRDPLILHELFDVLGNDAQLIAETLARQTLVSNMVRAEYQRVSAEAAGFEAWWKKASRTLRPEVSERISTYSLPSIRPSIASGGGPALPVPTAPDARYGHTTVWTGNAMIVWGGEPLNNTGGIYDPPTDTWTVTSTGAGVPDARSQHSAVWTGSEMIVWGGLTAGGETRTGSRYVPATDSWMPTPTGTGCPSVRKFHTAVWTGTRMIVWGGSAGSVFTNTGGSYDPTANAWTATSTSPGVPAIRARHTAIWTGTQMIVWGGTDSVGGLNTGGRYTAGTNSWSAMSLPLAPVARIRHTAVWTGTQMIVWGGFGTTSYLATGGLYNPAINRWSVMAGGPSARAEHTAVWTGMEMIVWGGQGPTIPLDDGGRYNYATDTWTAIAAGSGSPAARTAHGAVWTGQQMVVWGGNSGSGGIDSGGRYFAGGWSSTMTAAPVIRFHPRAWAGYLGGSATFTVMAGGNGPLTYQWKKDGVNLPVGAGVSETTSDTLVLTGLDAGDVGAYSVVVTNAVSSATSNDAALTVGSPRGGDVDPGFHRGAMFDNEVRSVIAQADGKSLVFGEFAASPGSARHGITRLNADGTTDLTFMAGLPGANDTVWAALQQQDGRILIGGKFTTIHGVRRNRIARLNADGSLDTTFQNGMEGAIGAVYAVALQPDGKVLIGGAFNVINGGNIFIDPHNGIARLNPDGSTDTSFAYGPGNGMNRFCQGCIGAFAIIVQPDGKILVGGPFGDVNSVSRTGLVRLNVDGTTDTTFLNGMSGPNDVVYGVTLQPDGRILLQGDFSLLNGVPTNGFGRLNPDGSLDPSFQMLNWLWPFLTYTPNVLQPDGKIVMTVYDEMKNGFRVLRLNVDGSVDPSFQDGLLSPYPVSGLSLRSDGKVLVGGTIQTVAGAPPEHVVLLNTDGRLDPSFANPHAGIVGPVYAVVIQPDGRTIVGGSFGEVDGSHRGSIARLHADGSLDSSFQNDISGVDGEIYAMALQPDGRLLIAGWFYAVNGIARTYVARLHADGKLDSTFQNVSMPDYSSVRALVLQPDGKVLIGGEFTQVNGAARGNVARLNADGSLDTAFMNGMSGASTDVTAITTTPEGKVYIGGSFEWVNGASRKYAARLNADGSTDLDFWSERPFVGTLHAFALQPDGRLITAQFSRNAPANGYADVIARLNPDGSQDATFAVAWVGPGKEVNLTYPVHRVIAQPDGRVLLGGWFPSVAGTTRANIARLNADGTLDTSFEDTMTGIVGSVSDLALLPDGRVLAAGALGGANGEASGGVVRLYGSTPVAPAISTAPSNQVSHDGSCAVFHVTASGTPLDYQWRRSGVDLVDGPNVSGSQAATLTLTGVSVGDVGDYDCVVTNVLGGATTAQASLSIAAIPACKIATCDPVLGSILVDVPAPAEIASVQLVGQVSTTLSWTDLGGGALYDVASSTLADLRSGGIAGATCLANDVSGAGYLDSQPSPTPGNAYYYIVRGQSACGAGGYGTDSEGVPRVLAAACP